MVLFILSILIFNSIVYKMRKHVTKNQIVHIWVFTMMLVMFADIFMDQEWRGYWYFKAGIGWDNIVVYTLLIPPVNIIILNWFPFKDSWLKKVRYFVFWYAFIIFYEVIAKLPKPWGYFHYGWWKISYSLIADPILLVILLIYYRWICILENSN